MDKQELEPGQDGWVEKKRAEWSARGTPDPISMIVIEYWGHGDAAFGGSGDDRALGPDGLILTTQMRTRSDPVQFVSLEEAHEACKRIKNRRPDSLLGIAPRWR